jgi:hypothetical protein
MKELLGDVCPMATRKVIDFRPLPCDLPPSPLSRQKIHHARGIIREYYRFAGILKRAGGY